MSRGNAPEGGAFERLSLDTAPQLWRTLYGFARGRRQIAEDALAEAFARALEHAPEIRRPVPWIYRTAFRIATRELMRERRRLPASPDPVPGLDPSEVQDLLPDADAQTGAGGLIVRPSAIAGDAVGLTLGLPPAWPTTRSWRRESGRCSRSAPA